MESPLNPTIHLYTYFRSSCSARLRIALSLKRLPYTSTTINLLNGAQKDTDYGTLNPSNSVPTLIFTFPFTESQQTKEFRITQSIAALEYLDEAFPNTYQLLPERDEAQKRSVIRTLCGIIAADIQPVTNLRILLQVKRLGIIAGSDENELAISWAKELMTAGLAAYESICKEYAGRFSVGNVITMADCCLVPAIWGALRFGVNLEEMPTIMKVYAALSLEECVKVGHWQAQSDTPDDLKA